MPKRRDEPLLKMVRAQKQGRAVGIYSICSANRFALEAGMLQAKRDGSVVCIESTSNQVNQFGGYTGMKPAQFVRFVHRIASGMEFPVDRILLGGDHLGPHPFQSQPAWRAMDAARLMVHAYVRAGYTKIHLDASMRCADDPVDRHTPLRDETVAERAADLCKVAEAAYSNLPGGSMPPRYIIGTEVPIPGGAQEAEGGPSMTRADDAKRTISLAREAFRHRGLEDAWDRVVALVVQPGVEFGDADVFAYDRKKAKALSAFIDKQDGLVFEAHSTDYQTGRALREMVEDHFAILKIGPWVTFAFREAVFALAMMEEEWLAGRRGVKLSNLRAALEKAMLDSPANWQKHYHGGEPALAYARKYSYSDRSRYYWPVPEVQSALKQLLRNLAKHPAPLTLLSQYMPEQYQAVRAGRLANTPAPLIHDHIMKVMQLCAEACGQR